MELDPEEIYSNVSTELGTFREQYIWVSELVVFVSLRSTIAYLESTWVEGIEPYAVVTDFTSIRFGFVLVVGLWFSFGFVLGLVCSMFVDSYKRFG